MKASSSCRKTLARRWVKLLEECPIRLVIKEIHAGQVSVRTDQKRERAHRLTTIETWADLLGYRCQGARGQTVPPNEGYSRFGGTFEARSD